MLVFFGCAPACLPAGEHEAGPSEYLHRSWTKEHGLPDNQVHAVLQTHDGYLWVATLRGLARFDGLKFTVFDNLNTSAMKSANCLCLAEDSDGNLWIGTADGLLCRAGQTFVRFTAQSGLASSHVFSLCPSRLGGVWAGCKGGLNRVHQGPILKYPELGSWPDRWSICEDGTGVLWIGSHQLQRLDPQSGKLETIALPPTWAGASLITLQSDGELGLRVLFHHWGRGVRLYQLNLGEWQPLCQGLGIESRPDPSEVFLTLDRQGNLWFPYPPARLYCLRAGERVVWPAPTKRLKDDVLCATEDQESNLWLGTDFGGLLRWQPKRVQTLSAKDGLAHDNTWALGEDSDGSVWLGTDGGLSHFKAGQFTNYTEAHGLSRNAVRALALDQSSTLWIGTGSGLNSLRDGQFQTHPFPGEWFEGKVRVILPARDGALWVGTALGLHRIRGAERTKYTTADGLPHEDVRALLEDRAGNLWIGTFGGGLCKLVVPPSGGPFVVLPSGGAGDNSTNTADRLKPGLQTFTTTNGLSNNFV